MKKIIQGILAATLIFSMGSCIHDSCVDLNCRQGASCIDDHCQCPTGYEGVECEILSKERFVGTWVGTSKCDGYPQETDSVEIFTWCNPNKVLMKIGMGNFSTNTFVGTASTPELVFESYEDTDVIISPYIRVDANQMQITVVSVNKVSKLRYVCEFEGRRIPGSNELAGYNDEKGPCK